MGMLLYSIQTGTFLLDDIPSIIIMSVFSVFTGNTTQDLKLLNDVHQTLHIPAVLC